MLKKIINAIRRRLPKKPSKSKYYDLQTFEVMKKILRPYSVCVDVGCHQGKILEEMQRLSHASHYAFEPLPHLNNHIREHFTNIRLFDCALSDTTGEAEFVYVKNAPAYSGLRERTYDRPDPEIEKITVNVRTLDDIVNEPIAFIKIDVEGAEYNVMKGAVETIRKYQPVIVFEAGEKSSGHYNVTPDMIYDLIKSFGYHLSTMDRWLRGQAGFDKEEFIDTYKTEYYFIGYPY